MVRFIKCWLTYIIEAAFGLLLLYSCANIGTIQGGKKDSIPPVMVASRPLPLDTNFKGNKVIITFDEYFDLKDINKEFLASPPFKKNPDIKVKKKSLHIKFLEPLKDSVTYSLNFSNAIADVNEGNIYKNFSFVFSTYSVVDSFSIAGNLQKSFDLKYPFGAYVMAFDTFNDSVPYKSLPSYISKTDSSGNFSINHIKPGKYKIFALSDLNGNMKADEYEPRGFLDSLIIPTRSSRVKIDSLKAGTIIHDLKNKNLADSLTHDTVIVSSSHKNKPNDLQLYLFSEDNLNQRILEYTRKAKNKLALSFQLPLTDDFRFNILNATVAAENIILEKDENKDSLICWINDTIANNKDTLTVQLKYLKKDSLGVFVPKLDTIEFAYRKKQNDDAWKRKETKAKNIEKEYLTMNFLVKENKVDLNKNLVFESPTPLVAEDTSKIQLFEIKDTTTLDPKEQKIVKSFRQKKDLLYFKFKRPVAQRFWMEGLNFKLENWYTAISSDSNRIYVCQITNPELALKDTLKLKVHYDNHFFLGQIEKKTDTLIMPISAQKIISRKRNEPQKIDLVFDKPQNSLISILPEDFNAQGNWFQIKRNSTLDSLSILITDKRISDKDTLTFSVKCYDYIGLNGDSVYFKETTRQLYREKKQFLVSVNRPKKEEIKLVYNKSVAENPQFFPIGLTLRDPWYTVIRNQAGDTLNYKITDDQAVSKDTLKFIIKTKDNDRKGRISEFSDTVIFITKQKRNIASKTGIEASSKGKDNKQTVQIYIPVKMKLTKDSIYLRKRIISTNWKSNTKYTLRYDSLAFVDFFKDYNKAGVYNFSTREDKYYATLVLNLKNIHLTEAIQPDTSKVADSLSTEKSVKDKPVISKEEIKKYIGDGHIILQLLGDKGVVEKQYFVSGDKKVTMDFLHPQKYGLKIIFDRNNNGKWDTGNYFKHIQPERVIMSVKEIELKSGFEAQLEWNVGESLLKSFTSD